MPYSHAWSDNLPPVGALANTIGVEARQLRLDLEERLESSMIVDMSADPVVIRDEVAGKRSGDRVLIPHCAFLSDLNLKLNDIDSENGKLDCFMGSGALYAPVPQFLRGCEITLVEWLVDIHDVTNLEMRLQRRQFANGVPAAETIVTTNKAVAGNNIVNSGGISHIVSDGYYYYLRIIATAGGGGNAGFVYGARLTFNRPA